MPPSEASIVVVGAGLSGLACALALALRGQRVQVLEQAGGLAADHGVLLASPNAWRALHDMGLADELRTQAVFPDSIGLHDAWRGDLLQLVPLGACEQRYGQAIGLLRRSVVKQALLQACLAHELVNIRWNALVTSIGKTDPADPQAAPLLSANIGEEALLARAIIGADGAQSFVRQHVWGAESAAGRPYTLASCLVPAHNPSWQQWWAPGASVQVRPVPGQAAAELHALLSGHHPAHAAIARLASLPALQLYMAHAPAAEQWFHCLIHNAAPLKQWSKGRISLIGDAAHPCLPSFAQSDAMALEDALALADCAVWAPTMAQAFSAYERLRLSRNRRLQQASATKAGLDMASGLWRWGRNRIVRARSVQAPLESLAWLYEH